MVSNRARVAALVAALAMGACSTTDPQVKTPSSSDSGGRSTNVHLSYTRPAAFGRTGRPEGFEVIADYRASDAVTQYQGTWDDDVQTLTANVTFAVGSENLLYVIDEAVPSFTRTPVEANRGRLHETICPESIRTVQVCYELEVVSGY